MSFSHTHLRLCIERNGGFLHNSLSPLFTAKTLSHINIQVSLLYPKVTSRNHYERHARATETFNGKNVIVNYGIKAEEKSLNLNPWNPWIVKAFRIPVFGTNSIFLEYLVGKIRFNYSIEFLNWNLGRNTVFEKLPKKSCTEIRGGYNSRT